MNSIKSKVFPVCSVKENYRAPDGSIVSSRDLPGSQTDWSVEKKTLVGGLQQGVEVLIIAQNELTFTVILTRGMSVLDVDIQGTRFGWDSPVKQVIHPQHVNLTDQGGLGWLSGFNELMVRCGVAFAGHPGIDENGEFLTLHGRAGNIPASEVNVVIDQVDGQTIIRVQGLVEEKRFKFGVFELCTEVSTSVGENAIEFHDRLINQSDYDREYQLIYHTNFGPPVLDEGAKFIAPVKSVSPFNEYAGKDLSSFDVYRAPTPEYGEQVYCMTLWDQGGQTSSMVKNSAGEIGVKMTHDVTTLPYFTLWKNTDTLKDGYVTGLEPGTGYPCNRSIERVKGRLPKLGAGEETAFRVKLDFLDGPESVLAAEAQVRSISDHAPRFNRTYPSAGADKN